MGQTSLEGYVSVNEAVKECERHGVKVNLNSLKWRIDNGKISGTIRDSDIRKRRLVPIDEVPRIIDYYSKIKEIEGKGYYALSQLAVDVGLKERSLHRRAEKLGIKTIRAGNKRMMTKKEYDKWRILLSLENRRKNKTLTTGYVGRAWGVSHHLILYWIKRGVISADKINGEYRIKKEDFQEHGEEWRQKCGYDKDLKS